MKRQRGAGAAVKRSLSNQRGANMVVVSEFLLAPGYIQYMSLGPFIWGTYTVTAWIYKVTQRSSYEQMRYLAEERSAKQFNCV